MVKILDRGSTPLISTIGNKMYLTTIIDNFHGNKSAFISSSMEEVKTHLIKFLENWDCEYTEDELATILEEKQGIADANSKSYLEVTIEKIEMNKAFDL